MTRIALAVPDDKILEKDSVSFHDEPIPVLDGTNALTTATDFQVDDKGQITAEIDGLPKGAKPVMELFITDYSDPDDDGKVHVWGATVVGVNV